MLFPKHFLNRSDFLHSKCLHQYYLLPGILQELPNRSLWFQVNPLMQSILHTLAKMLFLICKTHHVSSQQKSLQCDMAPVYLFRLNWFYFLNVKFSNIQNFFHFLQFYAFSRPSYMHSQPGILFPILPFIVKISALPADLSLDIISFEIFLMSWVSVECMPLLCACTCSSILGTVCVCVPPYTQSSLKAGMVSILLAIVSPVKEWQKEMRFLESMFYLQYRKCMKGRTSLET